MKRLIFGICVFLGLTAAPHSQVSGQSTPSSGTTARPDHDLLKRILDKAAPEFNISTAQLTLDYYAGVCTIEEVKVGVYAVSTGGALILIALDEMD